MATSQKASQGPMATSQPTSVGAIDLLGLLPVPPIPSVPPAHATAQDAIQAILEIQKNEDAYVIAVRSYSRPKTLVQATLKMLGDNLYQSELDRVIIVLTPQDLWANNEFSIRVASFVFGFGFLPNCGGSMCRQRRLRPCSGTISLGFQGCLWCSGSREAGAVLGRELSCGEQSDHP